MCCCGNEHDKDPVYKTARTAACCTLTLEIISLFLNTMLYIGVLVAAVFVCSIAKWTSSGGTTVYSAPTYEAIYTDTCATKTSTYYTYAAVTSKTQCETAADVVSIVSTKLCDDSTGTTVTDNSIPSGCVCDSSSGSDVLKFNDDTNTVATTYAKQGLCKRTSTRRLQRDNKTLPADTKLVAPTQAHWLTPYLLPYFDMEVIEEIAPKIHKGRRLDACDDDKDCKELRAAAKDGCGNATLIIGLFWVNGIFTLLGVIFFSITSCGNCCKTCCGGYATQMKITMFYAVIAAIWAFIECILHAQLAGALSKVRDIAFTSNLSPDAVTVIDAIKIWNIGATVFFGILLLSRGASAYFMFQAQKVEHSSTVTQGVQMQVVQGGPVVQGQVIVQGKV